MNPFFFQIPKQFFRLRLAKSRLKNKFAIVLIFMLEPWAFVIHFHKASLFIKFLVFWIFCIFLKILFKSIGFTNFLACLKSFKVRLFLLIFCTIAKSGSLNALKVLLISAKYEVLAFLNTWRIRSLWSFFIKVKPKSTFGTSKLLCDVFNLHFHKTLCSTFALPELIIFFITSRIITLFSAGVSFESIFWVLKHFFPNILKFCLACLWILVFKHFNSFSFRSTSLGKESCFHLLIAKDNPANK